MAPLPIALLLLPSPFDARFGSRWPPQSHAIRFPGYLQNLIFAPPPPEYHLIQACLRRNPPDNCWGSLAWIFDISGSAQMGNSLICMPKKDGGDFGSRSKRGGGRSQRKMAVEEELLHRQALAMAIQQHQLSQRFDGSMSRRIGSTSSRRRTLPDSLSNGKQCLRRTVRRKIDGLIALAAVVGHWKNFGYIEKPWMEAAWREVPSQSNGSLIHEFLIMRLSQQTQNIIFRGSENWHRYEVLWNSGIVRKGCWGMTFETMLLESELVVESLENIETKKFVLVHGEGFGAWCWYKSISLLEEIGLQPIALDLTGSGIDHRDANSISTLAEYAKPLIDCLNNLPENEKVILVGHSCGGASISYALECCPNKISKAVFVSATMVSDGKRPFDVFAEELAPAEFFTQESQYLMYGNGKDKPPTGLHLDKQQLKGLYFNQSPSKDIALATVSMRPFPLGPIMEKLSLSKENYGTARRFFVQTLDNHVLSPDIQEKLVRDNPPEGVYKIKGSDHCPFFSKPQSLHKILVEIAKLP
ncbi:hypothetical protein ACLOJK_014237 [Asimina triloba]